MFGAYYFAQPYFAQGNGPTTTTPPPAAGLHAVCQDLTLTPRTLTTALFGARMNPGCLGGSLALIWTPNTAATFGGYSAAIIWE